MITRINYSLFVFVFLLATGMVRASNVPPAAVYDFASEASIPRWASMVTAYVTTELAMRINLVIVERSELNKALREQVFGSAGFVNANAAAQIGQLSGAKVLITGQVIETANGHLILIANIIGVENSRLFATQTEGNSDNLIELCTHLSDNIAKTLVMHSADLVVASQETPAARAARIVSSVTGSKRPSIAVSFYHSGDLHNQSYTANAEMGVLLQQAGFPLVEEDAERKPDLIVSGDVGLDMGNEHNGIRFEHAVIELKVIDRRDGHLLVLDRQEATATDSTTIAAGRAAEAWAVDQLAARFFPLLGK